MYFDKPGKQNTEKTLQAAVAAAKERGIRYLVAASNSGYVAKQLMGISEPKIIIVSSVYGFKDPMPEPVRAELVQAGIRVVTAAHALSGAERALSSKFGGIYPVEIAAYTLRMFGQGTKVCVECAMMAADNGAIPTGEPIVAVGGSGGGADTALILKAATTQNFLDTKIIEYICKPKL